MATIAQAYTALAVTILSSIATFSCIAILLVYIIRKNEDDMGQGTANVCVTGFLSLMFTVLTMGLCGSKAESSQHRRRMVFGPESNDPDRIRNIRILRWLRLFSPVFSWAWILATAIYVILCVILLFQMSITMAAIGGIMGIPTFVMVCLNRYSGPSVIRSLEIISGYTTNDDFPLS